MTVRIEFPFASSFEFADPGTNSREVRTDFLRLYLMNSGFELGDDVENFTVTSFRGDDNGEFWEVEAVRER